jgi:hypothetical protein
MRVRAAAAMGGRTCMVAMAGMSSMSVTNMQVAAVSSVAVPGGVCSAVMGNAAQRHCAKPDAPDTETQHIDVHRWAASRPAYRYGFVVPGI